MNKKVKALVGSALAIAMSASVAAGATFALFTDKAEVNVAITAGKVDVEAAVENFKIYSMDRECANNTFENLGSAKLEGNKITLTNITPGDKVVFDLNLSSGSNVKTKVRTVIYETGVDDGLLKGLKVTVNGAEASLTNGAIESDWETVDPNNALNKKMAVSIELPVEAGNEYQEKVAELRFVIEAVQWNAEVESNTSEKKIVINTEDEFLAFANSVNSGNNYQGWNVFLNTNVDLDGAAWTPIDTFYGNFDGQGYEVSDFVVKVDKLGGLFGGTHSHIKNLTVSDAYIESGHFAGGIVAYNYGSVTGCTVTNSTIVGVDAEGEDGDKIGGIVGIIGESGKGYQYTGNTVKDTVIIANRDVGGIAGASAGNVPKYVDPVFTGNTVENVDIYWQVEKDYTEAGEIISDRKPVAVADGANTISNVTITKVPLGGVNGEAGKAVLSAGTYASNPIDNANVKVDGVVTVNGDGTYTVYESAQEAMTVQQKNIVVELAQDTVLDVTAWEGNDYAIGGGIIETITINGNGHVLNFNQKNSDWNNIATNGAKLIINNAHITNSGYNNGPWNRHDINFNSEVELNNVTSDKALAFKAGATLNNVTINDANTSDTYAIWIQPNGQTINIDGLTIDMIDCSDGRGIKIDEQYVATPKKVTLNVKNATFKTEEKSAILVKSVAGADITLENVDISGVAADSTNAVWVDEASEAYADLVVVTGASKIVEP